MHFGFSYVGLIYLAMLFIPNLFWTKNKPENYDKYVKNESQILRIFEGVGQAFVACIVLVFRDFNIQFGSYQLIWLVFSFLTMILYEIYWIKYFKSKKTMKDFYGNLLGIPVAGASLPVVAFLLLGVYGRNIPLIVAVIFLGIGHIGIHMQHKKDIE